MLAMPSNLLAHHLRVLEEAGLVARHRSEGDRRRSYLRLVPGALDALAGRPQRAARRVVFVCTANSARSQLAAALWRQASQLPAASAGTHPADAIDPGAVAPRGATSCRCPGDGPGTSRGARDGDLVITVCDNAHEELGTSPALHWSVPDPVRVGARAASTPPSTSWAGESISSPRAWPPRTPPPERPAEIRPSGWPPPCPVRAGPPGPASSRRRVSPRFPQAQPGARAPPTSAPSLPG